MQTLTSDQFKKKFGDAGIQQFNQTANQNTQMQQPLSQRLGNDISSGISTFNQTTSGEGTQQGDFAGESSVRRGAEGFAALAGTPLAAMLEFAPQPVRQGVGQVGGFLKKNLFSGDNSLSNSPAIQQWTQDHPEAFKSLSDILGTSGAIGNVANDILAFDGGGVGAAKAAKAANIVIETASKLPPAAGGSIGKITNYVSGAAKDIVPTKGGFINHQVSQALDLTPGDLSNISKSTGNDVGEWLADNNLIGKNRADTQNLIDTFKSRNYNEVRDQIGAVKKTYKPSQVPRYTDALKQIESKIKDVPGLEKEWSDVSNLLAKKDGITLNDVQHVKELLDDHFNLYKVTGDVAEGVAKEGLANVRQELKSFIEDEVKNETGADIKQLNNNVATGRGLSDAITTRAPKGLTKGNLKIGDLGIFGVGMSFGGPLGGAALLFGKKLLESPTIRLRIARYVDELDDAQQAKIKADLESGKIPDEFGQFIKGNS